MCYPSLLWPSIRKAWRAAVHGVAKSRTWLSSWTELMSEIHEGNHILVDSFLENCSPWTLSHWQLNVSISNFKRSSLGVPGGGSCQFGVPSGPARSAPGMLSFVYPSQVCRISRDNCCFQVMRFSSFFCSLSSSLEWVWSQYFFGQAGLLLRESRPPCLCGFVVVQSLNHALFFVNSRTAARQAPPSSTISWNTIFLPFHTLMKFSGQEYWSGPSFPPPVDHVWSELFTRSHPSWVTLPDTAHSFVEFARVCA